MRNKRKRKERKRKEKEKKEKKHCVGEKKEKGRFSRCSDGRSLIVLELKSVHTTRATCGYRNLNFFIEAPRGKGFLIYWFLFI